MTIDFLFMAAFAVVMGGGAAALCLIVLAAMLGLLD